MSFWSRRKSLASVTERSTHNALRRTLSWYHLLGLGVGGIVGTGIYTLTGTAAGLAGPSVILSFVVAGIVCACAALAYAELSTLMPAAGSAYTYSYVALNEPIAWFVGWSLILEYTVVGSVVSVGWSGYASGFIKSLGWPIPDALLNAPDAGGILNVPAMLIALAVAGGLAVGSRESATINLILVFVKLIALGIFIALALPVFDSSHFQPFAPYGYGAVEVGGVKRGMMAAAGIIFFAFYGFDAVSTAAEEARNPTRDLKIGIIGSMVICTLLYMVVAAAALGGSSYIALANSAEPLAMVLRDLGHSQAARVIAAAAVIALPTVIMAFLYGQSRVFFVMARDGLLPSRLSTLNKRTGSPVLMTMLSGLVVALLAGLLPLAAITALANAGTLCAFIAVAVCMLVLRRKAPDAPRKFRAPAVWLIGPVAIVGCIYLFFSLSRFTQIAFVIWNVIGIAIYLLFARFASKLAKA
jgi:basic amino acid/polyamine antiporter, APA family